jgi:hypothetical protein
VRLLGIFVTACVVLAAAQAIAAALAILLLIAFIYGIFAYPRETLGLLAFSVLAGMVEAHPLPCLGVAALAIVARLLHRMLEN